MEQSFVKGIVALVKSAFTEEKTVLSDDFDFESAYKIARKHNIVPIIYYGIINSGLQVPAEVMQKFFSDVCQNIAVCERQKFEISILKSEFEKNCIDFMPLKGTIIRDFYPKAEMRAMGDADILIKFEQYDKIVEILQEKGYTFLKEGSNELVWSKQALLLELHRYLVSPQHVDYFKVFGDGWKYAKPAEGYKYKYEMSDEDFFVFMFVHMAKHYRSSGVGIKHIVDIWLYRNSKPELDEDYIKTRLEELKMFDFYKNILKTIDVWFGDKEFDDITYLITEKIFSSGVFGTNESANKSQALKEIKSGKETSRIARAFGTIFLPYYNMCLLFPVLKKVPLLLPFFWIYRGIYTVLFKKGTLTRHFNAIKQLSPEQLSQYEKELNAVGLDYRFEE